MPNPAPIDAELTAFTDSLALVADLGRRTATTREVQDYQTDGAVVARILHRDEELHVESFERYGDQPRRPRGAATLHDPIAFAEYAERLGDLATTLWADQPQARVTALFNDHLNPKDHDELTAGWRDHTAVLQLQTDPDWQAWTGRNNQLSDQASFAEFLEQYAAAVIDPDAATMLEVARSFTAARDVQFDQKVNLTSSDVQLKYTEQTTAKAGEKGTVEVPKQFTVRLAPYLGVDPVDMIARLRWRLRDGTLGIGYTLHRPDLVAREAFARVVATIGEHATSPLYWGQAPAPVRAE